MAARFLEFLAFLLLSRVGAGGLPVRCSIDCGAGSGLELFEDVDGMRFFVDGEKVDAALFCSAVGIYGEKGCDLDGLIGGEQWKRVKEEYCSGSGLSASASVKINRLPSRKIAKHDLENSSVSSKPNGSAQLNGRRKFPHLKLSSEKMTFIAPSALLVCCVFLCPCFYAKRRDNPHESVSSGKLNKADSVPSSLDTSTLPERTVGTPTRIPPSPLRVVSPSPLRVPMSPSRFSSSPQLSRVGSVHLTLKEISRATQNFSPSNIIGEGGFGTVYKAQLPDGQFVSIKRARKEQASSLKSEFRNEVELLSKIDHRNLVRLLGYTEKQNERIIITEYVPNGNLREHLDGHHAKILDFHQRLEISIDVAHALTYLHSYSEKQIIHRDVKASNILLTEGFRAKVADFGFARSGPANEDQTHISTGVKGTAGYLDPEYLRTYQLTPKSDVFSFGILLIEILSGRRPVEMKRPADERITVKWAFNKYDGGNTEDILDPELEEVVDTEILSKLFDLAFQCAAPTRADRPEMKDVVEKLWEIRKDYGRSRRSRS